MSVLLTLASPAEAGVVSVDQGGQRLQFTAGSGEANILTIAYASSGTESGETTVTDAGAPLQAGEGCRAVDATTAVCARSGAARRDAFALADKGDTATFMGTSTGMAELRVVASGGADVVSLASFGGRRAYETGVIVFGDGGDDTLRGGPAEEFLLGGPGNDVILGGRGSDTIFGQAGNDRADGGSGFDSLAFSDAPRPVVANLSRGTALGWGRDRMTSIERLSGSLYSDSLTGNGRENVLVSGPGDDHLRGRGGRDLLLADVGADRLVGGAGPDVLEAAAGRDVLVGGFGRDRLIAGPGDDVLIARDGDRDLLYGDEGKDRGCIDRRLDRMFGIEAFFCRVAGTTLTG